MAAEILVIGGGISGLLASYVLKRRAGCRVRVLEPGRLGGDFLAGGLRYLHSTPKMGALLDDLGVERTEYCVRGGILLKGVVHPYPAHLKTLDKASASRIQEDHYKKTRRLEPDGGLSRSMNDPEAAGPRSALEVDLADFVRKLALDADVVRDRLSVIRPDRVVGVSGIAYGYTHLVLTIPLWLVRRMCYFRLPDALAMKLNVVQIHPLRDPYAAWDYVYTPYTPDDLIHRISPRSNGYSCEFNGDWTEGETNTRLTSELNFLFPDGWALDGIKKGLNGHLLPLSERPLWPENIRPLGRFAQWDSRATSDVVLESAVKIADGWGLLKGSDGSAF